MIPNPFRRTDIVRKLLPATLQPIDYSDAKIKFVTDRCRGKRVLDLGCVMHEPLAFNNSVFLHRALKETAGSLVGLDLNEEGVENMRSRGYDVRVGNAEDFDLGEQFGVIVAGDIIEHLSNLDGFMRSVDRHLAPGGVLLAMSPNPWFWKAIVQAGVRSRDYSNAEHTCWFCPQTWRQLVERYGFTIRGLTYYGRYRRDFMVPLPRGLRMPAWGAETVRA